MAQLLPTRKTVSEAWEAYSKLRQAETLDPQLANDNEFVAARDRAHQRWSEAFVLWGGE
jgi:hypothetical protein